MVLAGCASLDAPVVLEGDPEARGWELVWSDEFEGQALDRTKWAPEVSCWGGGNQERQCYRDHPSNVSVSNGYLTLTARPESVSGPSVHMEHPDYPGPTTEQAYSSGKVRSRDLAYWQYGRIEGRMRLPKGQGAWPAFWMMPQFDTYGGWPLSGEIDIMEAVNLGTECRACGPERIETRSSGALHFGDIVPDNVHVTKRQPLSTHEAISGSTLEEFHTFAVEWGRGRFDWFVDDRLLFTASEDDWYTASVRKSGNAVAPFDQPFYVMLNFAVGGTWPEGDNEGGVDPDAFPSSFIIDYVRVYQCADDRETGLACMNDG